MNSEFLILFYSRYSSYVIFDYLIEIIEVPDFAIDIILNGVFEI